MRTRPRITSYQNGGWVTVIYTDCGLAVTVTERGYRRTWDTLLDGLSEMRPDEYQWAVAVWKSDRPGRRVVSAWQELTCSRTTNASE